MSVERYVTTARGAGREPMMRGAWLAAGVAVIMACVGAAALVWPWSRAANSWAVLGFGGALLGLILASGLWGQATRAAWRFVIDESNVAVEQYDVRGRMIGLDDLRLVDLQHVEIGRIDRTDERGTIFVAFGGRRLIVPAALADPVPLAAWWREHVPRVPVYEF